MGKGFLKKKRQLRRLGKDADRGTGVAEQGPCFKEGCVNNGCTVFHCQVCEKRYGVGATNVRRIQTCLVHFAEAERDMKAHALTKHPSVLVGVVAAGLKGEEI